MKKSEVGKSESPQDSLKSNPDSYRDESPKSEVKPKDESKKRKADSEQVQIDFGEIENTSLPVGQADGFDIPIAIGTQFEIEKKSEVGSPESEEKNTSAPDNYRDDILQSEIEHPHPEIKELPTANSKLPTENTMEVHHHPEVEKKGFKEYLLEGIMIFLAVFMGFIAENIRERVADHEREQQYMESLVRDLALDTVALKAGFPVKEKRIEAIDSVFLFFESHPQPKTIPFKIYLNIRRTTWDRIFSRNTGTINQLKNAGGLRLVRKTDVRDSLATYDWLWDRLDYYKEVYYTGQQIGNSFFEKMLNAHDLIKSYRLNNTGISISEPLSSSGIISINTAYLNEYLNFLYRQKFTTIQDEQNYKRLERKAALLIKMIKKEYDIE